ncbi:TonB-dependent siderophore receptor, partial [Steroidobacter sp.]|uniref:TonB-dependent siderophore receptor n=1 Tax=Steroidobacter sp. TaxID=1978227 RepID=UPI001A603CFA
GIETVASYDLEIPSQDLHAALQQLALASHHRLFYKSAFVAGKTSPALSGSFTTEQALRQLLSGTDLVYEITPEAVVLIRPRAEAVGSAQGGASWIRIASADTGSGAESSDTKRVDTSELTEIIVNGRRIDAVTMMKRGETLLDTPQAVTIIGQARIDEQKLTSVSAVLDQTPGLTVVPDSFGRPNTYYARGFEITNIQIDGASVEVGRSYYFNPNLAGYEQVEVLRGADGLFAGSGDPGGTVNLARKRAKAEPAMTVSATAGRWNNYGAQVDITGPLAFDGRLRGRVVADYHDREFFYDNADDKGSFFYGTLEGDVTDSTMVMIGASLEKTDQTPWQVGLPRYKSGAALGLSRSQSLAADWSTWDSEAKESFLRFEQKFGDRWMLQGSATRGHSTVNTLYSAIYGYDTNRNSGILPGSTTGLVLGSGYDYDSQRNIYDVSLQGKFDLFGKQHVVLLGYDKMDSDNISSPMSVQFTVNGVTSIWGPAVNIAGFDGSQIPYPNLVYRSASGTNMTRQQGIYGKLQLQIFDPLQLIIGGRYFDYTFKRPSQNYNASGAVTSVGGIGYADTDVFTPYGGLLYSINPHWTLYASYTEIYRSQAQNLAGPLPGRPLDPMTGRNYEIGTKAALRDGRLNASFALYRTERIGEAEQDFNYPLVLGGAYTGNCCYLEKGEILSQGVDMEISGEVLPDLSVFAGYTYNKNENKRSGAVYRTVAPKHLFKLWSTYRLPILESKMTVGGGVTVQTEQYVNGTVFAYNPVSGLYNGAASTFAFTQGGYALVNAMLSYELTPTWSLSLNGNNLLDKTYYKGLGGGLVTANWYGEPRNVIFGARAKF